MLSQPFNTGSAQILQVLQTRQCSSRMPSLSDVLVRMDISSVIQTQHFLNEYHCVGTGCCIHDSTSDFVHMDIALFFNWTWHYVHKDKFNHQDHSYLIKQYKSLLSLYNNYSAVFSSQLTNGKGCNSYSHEILIPLPD
jgi:hypothetical protein